MLAFERHDMGRISEFIFDNVEDLIKSILLRRISFVNE